MAPLNQQDLLEENIQEDEEQYEMEKQEYKLQKLE